MVSPSYLTSNELADFWRHAPNQITTWRQQHLLTADAGTGSGKTPYRYFFESIDTVHVHSLGPERQHLASRIPRTEDLLQYARETGRPAFRTATETIKWLDIDKARLHADAAADFIVGLSLFGGRKVLYPGPEVDAYAARFGLGPDWPATGMPREIVMHLTGLTRESILALSSGDTPRLLRTIDTAHPRQILIANRSVMEYLRQNLQRKPDGTLWMSETAWCVLRITRKDRLVNIRYIEHRFHVGGEVVKRLIENGTLPCLWTGRTARIPLHAVERWHRQYAKTKRKLRA